MMMNFLHKSTWLMIVLMLAITAKANTYHFYFIVNISSCNNCDQLSNQLKSSPRLLKEASFLFSGDDLNREKAKAYMKNIFGTAPRVTINKSIYDRIQGQRFQTPSLVIYDSAENKYITSFPVSDIHLKQDLIDYYLDHHKTFRYKSIQNKQISRLTGCRNIDKAGNKLIINSAESKNRCYIFDLNTQSLDSLFIADDLLQKLYEQAGYNANLSKQSQNHPGSPVSFFPNGSVDGYHYNSTLTVFYYDPGDAELVMLGNDSAYINPGKAMQYFISYHTIEKTLKLQPFDYWQDPPAATPFDHTQPKYKQDFHYIKWLNDSTWISSGNKALQPRKEFSQTKLFLKFVRPKNAAAGSNKWIFSGSYDSLYIDSMFSYKGTPMDESQTANAFEYKLPYLYHNESPLIFNRETNQLLNLTDYEKDINWTFDIQYTGNLLHVLVQRYRKGIFRYTFNRTDHSLAGVQMVYAEKDAEMRSIIDMLIAGENPDDIKYQSNLLLDNNTIYFLHKNGEIVMLEK